MKKILLVAILLYALPLHAGDDEELLTEKKRKRHNFPRICYFISSGAYTIISAVLLVLVGYGANRLFNQFVPEAKAVLNETMVGVGEMKQACDTCVAYLKPADEFFNLFLPLMKRCPGHAAVLTAQMIEFIQSCCDN